MQNSQLQELALGLAGLLGFQIPQDADPFEPTIILEALSILFPQDQAQLVVIKQVEQPEQQWSCVLEYIEINLLDGQTLEIQSLGQEEITEIYLLLIQFAQHAIKQQEEEELLRNRKTNNQSKKLSKERVSQDKQKKKQFEKAISKNKQQKGNKQKKSKQIETKNNRREKQQKIPNNPHETKIKDSQGKKKRQGKEPKIIQQRGQSNSKSKQKAKVQQKEKNVINQQSKSKSKSKNKHKEGEKHSPSRNNNNQEEQKKEVLKKQSPKKEIISNQLLQNEAIRQITAAMKQTKKKQTNKILLKDPKSHEEVLKAKRQFDYYLNEFKRKGKQQKSKKEGKGILDQYFLKVIEKRQKNIQQTIVNEQIKYLLQLRDKKIAFINKIHKLTEKLQRERVIEKEKQQKKLMEQQRIKTQLKIQQSNAVFDKNMQLLKQNYKVIRQKNELQTYDERIVCRQMQECMKRKKLDQLQELKLLWQQQNLKLNNIMGDEQKIKSKLIDIYRKNRP